MKSFIRTELIVFSAFFTLSVVYAANNEDTELEKAQANMAKGYTEYFRALRASPSGKAPDPASFIGNAQSKLVELMDQRNKESRSQVFGKAYFSNGEVLDLKTQKKEIEALTLQLEAEEKAADSGQAKDENKSSSPNFVEVSPNPISAPASQFGKGGGSFGSSGQGREQWVLDGSSVPKELVFEGKPSSRKPASAEPKEKDR